MQQEESLREPQPVSHKELGELNKAAQQEYRSLREPRVPRIQRKAREDV